MRFERDCNYNINIRLAITTDYHVYVDTKHACTLLLKHFFILIEWNLPNPSSFSIPGFSIIRDAHLIIIYDLFFLEICKRVCMNLIY